MPAPARKTLPARRAAWKFPFAGLLLVLILLAALAGVALAAGEQMQRSAMLSGGGGRLASGPVVLQAAVGQPLSGVVVQGGQQLCSGMLCGWQAQVAPSMRQVYLPVMHK